MYWTNWKKKVFQKVARHPNISNGHGSSFVCTCPYRAVDERNIRIHAFSPKQRECVRSFFLQMGL